MTEFVIAATFVLLPLFVFIPMLGKYIDFKHATIQAARYQAWEYTVWYEDIDDRDILDNFNTGHADFEIAEKPILDTQNESQVRTMSFVGNYPADSGDTSLGAIRRITADDRFDDYTPRPLWDDHRGDPFYAGDLEFDSENTNADDDTPTITIFGVDVGSWLNTIVDIVQVGFDVVGAIINFIDSISGSFQSDPDFEPGAGPPFDATAGFSALHTDGYSHTSFDAIATMPANLVPLRSELAGTVDETTKELRFTAGAGVLAAGWNAGGTAHTYLQVGGTTPSTLVNELLNLPGLSQIWDLISFIAPELSRCDPPGLPDPLVKSPLAAPEGHLWLGYVDGDMVHPDRLSVLNEDPEEHLGSHTCDDSGRCTWDEDVLGLEEPLSHSPCTL